MNILSQLIYFAGVSENLAGFSGALSAIFFFGSLFAAIACAMYAAEYSEKPPLRYPIIGGILFLVFGFVAVALPSRETVYAIAASEMGEELLKTPTAKKATKALDAWLDKQIKENTNAQD